MSRTSNEKIFAILIGLPSVYLYLSGLGQFFTIASLIKGLIYPIVFLFGMIVYQRTICKRYNFIFISVVSCVIIFSVLINENITKYLIDISSLQTIILSDLFSLYLVAFPALFIAKDTVDFELLLEELYAIGYVIISLFAVTFFLLIFVYRMPFDYMNITYGAIPWLFFVSGYAIYKRKRVALMVAFVAIVFIIISGCRGATVTTFLFGILLYASFLKSKFTKKKFVFLLVIILIGIVMLINMDTIITDLYYSLKKVGFNSRTLELYLEIGYEKSLNHYSDRAVLQIPLIERFNLVGHGIYSDRILLDGIYAHNVLLEWIYDFGVFIGGFFCFYLFYKIFIKCKILFVTHNVSLRIILAACISVMMCKYMVSSSYLHAPEFWVLLGFLINKNMYPDKVIKNSE